MTEPLTDEQAPATQTITRIDVIESRSAPHVRRRLVSLPVVLAVGVWVVLILGVFARVLVQKPDRQSVVPIYLTGAERWLESAPLYPPIPGMDLYRNPPGVAALFAPLTALPPKAAAILWRLACLIPYLIGVRGLIRDLLPPPSVWKRAWVWVFAAVLVLPAFNNGQINMMILAAAVCGVVACSRQQWWIAAAWLAFAGWWKVYPLAVGLLCVLVAPRQLGWRLATMTAMLFGLPFLFQNPMYVWDRHIEFLNEMNLDDRTLPHIPLSRVPRDWTIVPRLWMGVAVSREMAQVVGLVVAAGLAGWVWYRRNPGTAVPGLSGSLFVAPLLLGLIWITLFGPSTEMNTYSMLAPVVGVLICSRSRWVSLCGWFGGGLLTLAIVRASFPSGGPYKMMEVQAIAAGVLLVGTFCWRAGSVSDRSFSDPGRSRSQLATSISHPY